MEAHGKSSAAENPLETPAGNPYTDEAFAPYYKGDVQDVSDESFAALLGHPIPDAKWDRNAPMGFNDTIGQCRYLPGGFGKQLCRLIFMVRKLLMAVGKKELANNVMFVMDLPWRGAARMSGVLTEAQVMALIRMANREKGGFRKFLAATFRRT